MTPAPPLTGYHHLTMVTKDAARAMRFYTETLRLRLVKQTVNFDHPHLYHLYFGDYAGAPGTLLTFFEWPRAKPGHPGIGGTHHVALAVGSGAALAFWRGRLERAGCEVSEPFIAHGYPAIHFVDPDGLFVELCAPAGEDVPEGAPALWSAGWTIGGIHHVVIQAAERERTLAYYRDLLGFAVLDVAAVGDAGASEVVFELPGGRLLIAAFPTPPAAPGETGAHTRFRHGAGQTHHLAFGARDDAHELAWRARLAAAGADVSEARDRRYFRSIYVHDPDGHLLEIATHGPGFAVDEAPERLGSALMLPPWLEERRAAIVAQLAPLPPGPGAASG